MDTWSIPSSKLGAPPYTVELRADDAMTCTCDGWKYTKIGQPRRCRHVQATLAEAERILGSPPLLEVSQPLDVTTEPVLVPSREIAEQRPSHELANTYVDVEGVPSDVPRIL